MKLITKLYTKIKNINHKIKNKYTLIKNAAENKQYWDSLARQVSPAVIQEFPEHIIIDNRLIARTLIVGIPPTSDISGYPADLNNKVVDELLSISAEGHSIAFSYAVIPIQNIDAMKMLDQAIFSNKVSQESYKDKTENGRQDKTKQPPLKKIFEEQDFAANYKEIYENKQKMYHTAFIVIIWGESLDKIREAESHVRIVLESNRIYYEFPSYRQLETFLAAQPYPLWSKFSWIELFSYHASALVATRNPNSRTDDKGLYFGDDMKTGKNIQIDLKTLAAQHLMFVGPTGSGKTFTLLMLLMRSFDLLGKRIIYTTPKADVSTNYRNVAEYYGNSASIIDIGPRGHNINPLQILYDETVLQDEIDYMHVFDEHMELLDQFFAVLFEGTKTINMSNYLNETLMQVYRQKGIEREKPKTWKNANWPTMIDLRAIWLEAAKNPKDATAKALVDKTFMVTTAWDYMNKPTDINTSADFIIVDISGVPASIQDAMNVFVTGIMAMRFKTDVKKETIIAVDEAAVFLRNPKLSAFLLRTLTQGRSYNLALWLATQQTADLEKANLVDEFKTNISISIVLGNMRKDTMSHVTKYFQLNEHNVNDLMGCGVGEGLLIIGSEVIPTKFIPTAQEMAVIKGQKIVDQLVSSDVVFELVDESLKDLIIEHQLCFSSWVKGDPNPLLKKGYTPNRVQNALGVGPTQVWTKAIAGNQTLDHYATVLQLAGHFIINGIPIIEINHYDDVDVVAEIGGKKIAFEYERPRIHTIDELINKKELSENKYDRVVFIAQTANLKFVSDAVGEKNTIKRGIELLEFVTELMHENTTTIARL